MMLIKKKNHSDAVYVNVIQIFSGLLRKKIVFLRNRTMGKRKHV